MAEKPSKNSPAFGTLRPYEPGMLEGIGARLQDFMVDKAGVSRPVARDVSSAVGFSRPDEAPLMRATDVLGGPLGVGVAAADFAEDPGLLTGVGVPLAALPIIGGPLRRGLRGLGGNGGPPLDDAVQAAREKRKEAGRERTRIKEEALGETTTTDLYVKDKYEEAGDRVETTAGIETLSKVRQELESIGMGKGAWSKEKVVKELNKRGVTTGEMEATGILAFLERNKGATKKELVDVHEKYTPEIAVIAKKGDTEYYEEQRIGDLYDDPDTTNPSAFVDYSEVQVYNTNKTTARDYGTSRSHLADNKGELGHARTSKTMLPGIGRAEVGEEFQTDLFKTKQTNMDLNNPAKKRGSLEKQAKAGSQFQAKFDGYVADMRKAVNNLGSNKAYQESRNNPISETVFEPLETAGENFRSATSKLDEALARGEQDETLLNKLSEEAAQARRVFEGGIRSANSLMYDLAARSRSTASMIDQSTSSARKSFEEMGAISDGFWALHQKNPVEKTSPMRVLLDDSRRAEGDARTLWNGVEHPIMSPRVHQRADDLRASPEYTAYTEVEQKVTEQQRTVDFARRQEKDLQDKVRTLEDTIDAARSNLKNANRPLTAQPSKTGSRSMTRALDSIAEAAKRRNENTITTTRKELSDLKSKLLKQNSVRMKEAEVLDNLENRAETLFDRVGTDTPDDRAALLLLDRRSTRHNTVFPKLQPHMPFDTLNDATQFIVETTVERAIKNPETKAFVFPDYRDLAKVREADPAVFKQGYEDSIRPVIKRLQERYPGIKLEKRKLPGSKREATVLVFPENRGADKPLVQRFASGGMVYKGIGSMGKEVL